MYRSVHISCCLLDLSASLYLTVFSFDLHHDVFTTLNDYIAEFFFIVVRVQTCESQRKEVLSFAPSPREHASEYLYHMQLRVH